MFTRRYILILHDGWTREYRGRGVILRTNPEHIQRVRMAIRNRYDLETEITITEADNVVKLEPTKCVDIPA